MNSTIPLREPRRVGKGVRTRCARRAHVRRCLGTAATDLGLARDRRPIDVQSRLKPTLHGRFCPPYACDVLGRTRTAALIFVLAALVAPARAQSVEEFYRGKTVNLIIGYSVGGGYDLYGRLLARHIGKHIQGRPAIVAQNMTGAGSLRAAQYLYSVAPKDGTAFGTFGRTIVTTPLVTPASGAFDGTKFSWIGSITNEVSTCVTWHTSRVKVWKDILEHEGTMGGLGPGADPDIHAILYKNVFGAKVKLVTGYPGTNDAALAMERGEVDGLCGMSWSTLTSRHAQEMKEKKINILIQAALKKQPELPDVPLATELT